MAKQVGFGKDLLAVAMAIGGTVLLVYALSGRNEQNSPLIPDAIEDPIDRVVAALNQKFGAQWVGYGLDALQNYIQKAMPQVAHLVGLVLAAEQVYRQFPNSGPTKKQYVRLGSGTRA
jgi:hypothetical protein